MAERKKLSGALFRKRKAEKEKSALKQGDPFLKYLCRENSDKHHEDSGKQHKNSDKYCENSNKQHEDSDKHCEDSDKHNEDSDKHHEDLDKPIVDYRTEHSDNIAGSRSPNEGNAAVVSEIDETKTSVNGNEEMRHRVLNKHREEELLGKIINLSVKYSDPATWEQCDDRLHQILVEHGLEQSKKKILSAVHSAKYVSIVFDFTSDVSHIEQMAIIVRFVATTDAKGSEIKEQFLGFVPVSDTTGAGLTTTILEKFADMTLTIENLHVLMRHLPSLTLKPLSDTRWKSRINVLQPLRYQLEEVHDALIDIAEDTSLTGSHGNISTVEAEGLAKGIGNFRFVLCIPCYLVQYSVRNQHNQQTTPIQELRFICCYKPAPCNKSVP
ncbi:hypothetical protein PR048_004769 [Dryococelus australis]|uniref:DUF4371 domain-containing protein n=1 Tax=Dryococelus australis TaxID=614101 RepID=A0ABQ9I6A9_9NEOP|nr:hypothetical protein PR048_004769 [Dryococelus australis]